MRLPFATTMINWFRLPSPSFPRSKNGPPDPVHVEQLRQADPARFQRLAQFDQALRERQQRIAAIANARGVHEREQAHIDAVARAAARAKQDQAFRSNSRLSIFRIGNGSMAR